MVLSKTVYSLFYPETQVLTEELWETVPSHLFSEAYTGKQDSLHEEFLDTWKQWVQPVLSVPNHLTHFYPTAGSSEAIRDSIAQYVTHQRRLGHTPRLHVFTGEYEGYKAFAEAYGAIVVEHDRENYQESVSKILKGEAFYLSQPSSLDGNVWAGFNDFVSALPSQKLMLDLCYVGAVHREFTVDLNSPKIHTIFFSLSKVFGVYYHRIGGVICREVMPGLVGNKWFKNVFSLTLGIKLMNSFKIFELPKKYHQMQINVLERINRAENSRLSPSDVLLLGNGEISDNSFHQEYQRHQRVRVCITAELDKEIRHENRKSIEKFSRSGIIFRKFMAYFRI